MATDLMAKPDPGILDAVRAALDALGTQDIECQIETLNEVRKLVRAASPMTGEPVDCVVWVPSDAVQANDYNPNSVAAPEMELLKLSITADGYTQPIVVWRRDDGDYEVVDGFHRHLIGAHDAALRKRLHARLPVVVVNESRTDKGDRIASTIRHNRARGKHQVSAMAQIVTDLKRRNWSDQRIAKELGMEPDEVLRLRQVTGLADMFADREFSEAWEIG